MTFGEAFLVDPQTAPRTALFASHGPTHRPWGTRSICLDLPGGPYQFDGLADAQAAIVQARFASLCIAPDAAENVACTVHARVFRSEESAFRVLDVRGWNYTIDFDFAPGTLVMAGLRFTSLLEWEGAAITSSLFTPDVGAPTFAGIFENFCRVLVSYRVHERGGAVLHSAAVESGGGGFVFLGHSGAGKSTITRECIARGAMPMSDDLNALLPATSGRPHVAKLPFTGDLVDRSTGRASSPVRAFLRLEKSAHDRLRPLTKAELVATLVACAPIVNIDPVRRDELVANLIDLASSAPGYNLERTLSGTFWDLIHEQCPPVPRLPL